MPRQVQVLDVACDGEHECMEDFGRRDLDEGTDVLEHVETHGVNAHNDDDRKRLCGVLRGGYKPAEGRVSNARLFFAIASALTSVPLV